MCKASDRTITHIIFDCPKLLQKEYKRQHDWMGKSVHWDICRKKDFNVPEKRYEQKPCTENESFKIFWDIKIKTDNMIEYRRPDMIIIDKTPRKTHLLTLLLPQTTGLKFPNTEKLKTIKI